MTVRPQAAANLTVDSATHKAKVPQHVIQVALKEVGQGYDDSVEQPKHAVRETNYEVGVVSEAGAVSSEWAVVV